MRLEDTTYWHIPFDSMSFRMQEAASKSHDGSRAPSLCGSGETSFDACPKFERAWVKKAAEECEWDERESSVKLEV